MKRYIHGVCVCLFYFYLVQILGFADTPIFYHNFA